jgi:stage II sporulation protein GA (sporulation sigma-E factor processing peptidase)
MFFSLSTDSTLREIFHEIPCMLQWTCTIKDSGCTSVTLYLDVIFIENLVINFFLLKAVTLLLGIKCNNIRLLAGALIGSLYVVAMILWPERIFFHFSSKFLLSVVMVSVSFKPKSLKIFIKSFVIFLLGTFALAGIMMALDMSYSTVQIGKILVSLLLLVMIFLLIREWIMKKYKNCEYQVRIWFLDRQITLPALVDTGNFLKEPVTRIPVVIVDMKALEEFLPEDMYKMLSENRWTEEEKEDTNEYWRIRIRFIPYNTLDQESRVMIGFEADYVDIWGGDLPETRKKAVIGFSNKELSKSKGFKALINPSLMD